MGGGRSAGGADAAAGGAALEAGDGEGAAVGGADATDARAGWGAVAAAARPDSDRGGVAGGRVGQADLEGLPRLGVGISAEPESARAGADAVWLREEFPGLIHFLEYGTDLARGLDEHVRRWAGLGLPTTYHFLDLNLAELEDVDDAWLVRTASRAREIGAAWLCGDGGLWHFGPRERGHETLLPPILSAESADEMARSVGRVQRATGMAVLPENPPSAFYVGELHILDYFARVADRADCGLLLDAAHLAMFQRLRGLSPLAGLDEFPLERVIELHVAGGTPADVEGYAVVEDSHVPEPLPQTWQIVEHVVPRAPNLRAIVYECEKNPPEACMETFRRLNALFPAKVRG
jgi:uncharacterized protein (UPF0276 family)